MYCFPLTKCASTSINSRQFQAEFTQVQGHHLKEILGQEGNAMHVGLRPDPDPLDLQETTAVTGVRGE